MLRNCISISSHSTTVLPVPRFSRPIGRFFRLTEWAIFGGRGLRFLGDFGTCRGYWATAVLSGNQWSVDTANELIIVYGSKPVARAAWQETIGCIIHNTKDKSRANLPNRYSVLCWRPVTHAQTWASYSALCQFRRLSKSNKIWQTYSQITNY